MINYSVTIFKGKEVQQTFVRSETSEKLDVNNDQDILDYVTDFLNIDDNTLNHVIYSRFGRYVTFTIDDEDEVLMTWEVFQ